MTIKVPPITFILLSIAWMLIIFYLSSLPSDLTGPDTLFFKILSKMLHFIIFGILSMLYFFSLKWEKPLEKTGLKYYLLSLVLTIVYAMTDEYHQSFSIGRTPSFKDIILDASGAIIFLSAIFLFRKQTHLCIGLKNFK